MRGLILSNRVATMVKPKPKRLSSSQRGQPQEAKAVDSDDEGLAVAGNNFRSQNNSTIEQSQHDHDDRIHRFLVANQLRPPSNQEEVPLLTWRKNTKKRGKLYSRQGKAVVLKKGKKSLNSLTKKKQQQVKLTIIAESSPPGCKLCLNRP